MKSNLVKLDLKDFLKCLSSSEQEALLPFIHSSPVNSLRKTAYLSSSGEFYKYVDFMRKFTYKLGYVPIHPIETLGYYISTECHDMNKTEILKDCFSLLNAVDELWIFSEKYIDINSKQHLEELSEGVLAEIGWWLENKPKSPLRFYTFSDLNIAKYIKGSEWTLIKGKDNKNPLKDENPRKFGLIDLGSSTVKLSICYLDEIGNTKVKTKKSITVNLAEDFFDDSILKKLPMNRTINAIKDFHEEALQYGIVDIKLFGTGVSRKAKNILEFKNNIKNETGLDLILLSSVDEGNLVYTAVTESFIEKSENILVINAGGGTTELIYEINDKKIKVISLPIGISNLNELFMNTFPISEINYKDAKSFIINILKKEFDDNPLKFSDIVYTGGELDYMLITGFPLENYTNSLSHPKKIDSNNFFDYARNMRKMTLEELHSYMPENPMWMNGAIASNTLLETITEYFNVNTIIPSNKNLNDGILLNMSKN